ncbi:MAG: hypothetical protein GY809_13290, partial [Planctomycetes bacterium]|nr:hypothetical protein [Planctomycetota bacterium]
MQQRTPVTITIDTGDAIGKDQYAKLDISLVAQGTATPITEGTVTATLSYTKVQIVEGPEDGPYHAPASTKTWPASATPDYLWLKGETLSGSVNDVTLTVTHKYNDSGDANASYTQAKPLTVADVVMTHASAAPVSMGDVVPINVAVLPANLTNAAVTLAITEPLGPDFSACLDAGMSTPVNPGYAWHASGLHDTEPEFYVQVNELQTVDFQGTLGSPGNTQVSTGSCEVSPKVEIRLGAETETESLGSLNNGITGQDNAS